MRWIALVALVACSSSPSSPPPSPGKLELIDAPAVGDAAPTIAAEVTRATADGKQLVVYVGASWCEPCRYFHEAAVRGDLDATFPKLRLLVFDEDRDHDALEVAGYDSSMIPLFAVPQADGTSSGRQIEGSIKGEGAVAQITPRLTALLAPPSP